MKGEKVEIPDPGTFKWDHLQPVVLIVYPILSIILTFILGDSISYIS